MHDDSEKHKRLHKKMDAFMADVAEDMLEPGTLQKIEKKIISMLKHLELPTTLSYLKAFEAGFGFGLIASQEGGPSFQAPLIAGIAKIIGDKQKAHDAKIDTSIKGGAA